MIPEGVTGRRVRDVVGRCPTASLGGLGRIGDRRSAVGIGQLLATFGGDPQ